MNLTTHNKLTHLPNSLIMQITPPSNINETRQLFEEYKHEYLKGDDAGRRFIDKQNIRNYIDSQLEGKNYADRCSFLRAEIRHQKNYKDHIEKPYWGLFFAAYDFDIKSDDSLEILLGYLNTKPDKEFVMREFCNGVCCSRIVQVASFYLQSHGMTIIPSSLDEAPPKLFDKEYYFVLYLAGLSGISNIELLRSTDKKALAKLKEAISWGELHFRRGEVKGLERHQRNRGIVLKNEQVEKIEKFLSLYFPDKVEQIKAGMQSQHFQDLLIQGQSKKG